VKASSPIDLRGKTAIVTGGSRGIGRATCFELASRGANVAVNYRQRADAAQEVVAGVRDRGGSALAVRADVSDKQAVTAMVATVSVKLGQPDILVNNAGLLYRGQLLDYDEDEFDSMWRVNVKGVLYCSAAAAPGMIERGWGRIVNLASNAAIGTALPGTTLYAATKGAVLTLTKRFAFELSPSGITVNAVLPGFTKTDMVLSGKTPAEVEAILQSVASRSLVGRTGDPEDIASVTGFLCSPASSFMTGQFLLADGGRQDYLTRV
jgi:3-oxoacyl-[acyl-carrier protein] reductase